MDEYFETDQGPSPVLIRRLIFNLLTAVFLLASAVLGGAYVVILVNPQIPINPYPPPTLPPTIGPPTPTQTPAIYLPTEIPPTEPTTTPTFRPLPTATFTPTATPEMTATPFPTPTEVPITPATAEPGAQFELQPGSPTYIPDERGCNHMGVGGRVFDVNNSAIVGLAVRMGGELGGLSIGTMDTLTGSAADRFGFGGYYFELSDHPVASEDTLWIQVLDASSGLPLSDQVFVTTYDTCGEEEATNLVLVNWRQVGE